MSYKTFVLCNSPYVKAIEVAIPVFACLRYGYEMGFLVSNIIALVCGLIFMFIPPVVPVLTDGIIIPGIMIFSAVKLFLSNHIGSGFVCVAVFLFYEILRTKIKRLWRSDPYTASEYADRYLNH